MKISEISEFLILPYTQYRSLRNLPFFQILTAYSTEDLETTKKTNLNKKFEKKKENF